MKINFLYLALILIVFNGCTYRILDFTIVSTKNIDLTKIGTFKRTNTRTEGKDVAHIILYIPGTPNMKEAIDRAIEKIPGAVALVDGVIYNKYWWAGVYGQNIYVAEGTPIIDPSLADNSTNLPDYSFVKFDKKGNVIEHKKISKEEYLTIKQSVVKDSEKIYFDNSSDL